MKDKECKNCGDVIEPTFAGDPQGWYCETCWFDFMEDDDE